MGTRMAIGLLWEVGQKSNDELVGYFDKLCDIWLIGMLENPECEGVDETIEVMDCGGVDPISLVVLEGGGDDEELG